MNDKISKWLGECRHEHIETILTLKIPVLDAYLGRVWQWCPECGLCCPIDEWPLTPDYENDESAWTQELYGRIEEAGLHQEFAQQLCMILSGCEICEIEKDICSGAAFQIYWNFIKATPPQKAAALSRAIEEVA